MKLIKAYTLLLLQGLYRRDEQIEVDYRNREQLIWGKADTVVIILPKPYSHRVVLVLLPGTVAVTLIVKLNQKVYYLLYVVIYSMSTVPVENNDCVVVFIAFL